MDFSQEVVVPVRTHPASAGEEVHAESDDERRGRSVVDPADRHRPVVRLSADDYPVVAGLVDIAGEGSHVLPRRHAECDSRTLGGLGQGERRTVRSTSRRSEYRVAVPSILADAIFLGRPEQVTGVTDVRTRQVDAREVDRLLEVDAIVVDDRQTEDDHLLVIARCLGPVIRALDLDPGVGLGRVGWRGHGDVDRNHVRVVENHDSAALLRLPAVEVVAVQEPVLVVVQVVTAFA